MKVYSKTVYVELKAISEYKADDILSGLKHGKMLFFEISNGGKLWMRENEKKMQCLRIVNINAFEVRQYYKIVISK